MIPTVRMAAGRIAAGAILASLLAGPALAQDKPAQDKPAQAKPAQDKPAQDKDDYHHRCLEVGETDNWQAENDRTLIVENTWRNKFRLELMGPCPGIEEKQTIGFRAVGGTRSTCLSGGDMLLFRDFGTAQRCYIRRVTPLPDGYKVQRRRAPD